jgi:flagellar motor switch protein FliG
MIATTNTMHEAGIRKAAILVSSLDQATADLLLDQLGPERAGLVRQAVMALAHLDGEEQQRVLDEFRRIGPMVPDKSPPGIELDSLRSEDFLRTGAESPPIENSDADDVQEGALLPFGFLQETEEAKLSQLLGAERPQTIALVLSHLPPQRAGEVLARFAPALQVEVVRRLADLENADAETLREVEQALEARLSRQFAIERRRAAGPEAVAKILASCDGGVAGSILENLATYDRPLAEQLGHRPFDFDDLIQFDDSALLVVFRAAEPEVAYVALLGAPPQLVERLLCRLTPAEARRLRHRLMHPGPLRLSDVEEAWRLFALVAQRTARRNLPKNAFAA